MNNELYQLVGKIKIPVEKKDEFNGNVLRLLNAFGIRKTEELKLDGKTVRVAAVPEPDKRGMVYFDYSIFEKRKRGLSSYNMDTCELITPDRGYNEFGLAMNAVMVMAESYSASPCYFLYDGKPGHVEAYADIIRTLIGIDLSFPDRSKMWDMFLYLRGTDKCKGITAKDMFHVFPYGYAAISVADFVAVFVMDSKTWEVPEKPFSGEKSEIKNTPHYHILDYMYQLMSQFIQNGGDGELKMFLQKLLDSDLETRKTMAESDEPYGSIAEGSLYMLPPMIVRAYAHALGQDFWETWDDLGIKGYSDIVADDDEEKTDLETDKGEKRQLPLYMAIRRDSEDEFIEYWNDQELKLSDKMKECFEDWKERFQKIVPDNNFDMEPLLTEIFAELEEYGNCRLADKQFVLDCMAHKEDENYQKVLLLLKEIVEEDMGYFPELTRRQAIRWIMRECRNEFDYTEIAAFQSLIMNHKHRLEILGF